MKLIKEMIRYMFHAMTQRHRKIREWVENDRRNNQEEERIFEFSNEDLKTMMIEEKSMLNHKRFCLTSVESWNSIILIREMFKKGNQAFKSSLEKFMMIGLDRFTTVTVSASCTHFWNTFHKMFTGILVFLFILFQIWGFKTTPRINDAIKRHNKN